MTEADRLAAYAEHYFLPMAALARQAGESIENIEALIAAEAIPGPIYSIWPNGAFWSPIGGLHGTPDPEPVQHWYAPAAIWWIRRRALLGLAPDGAAAHFRRLFVDAFVKALPETPDAALGFPEVFVDGQPVDQLVLDLAHAEWADWINGGYGVCLRQWNAAHAIAKMVHRGRIVALTENGKCPPLPPPKMDQLIDAMMALDAVLLPFAPHQRPHGTPGLWIDRILHAYGLRPGDEAPRTGETGDRICA